jgi:peptidoglycan/xylan/chitin deacetylase (PgdA/CDA1 family)
LNAAFGEQSDKVARVETLVLCYHGVSPTWPAATTVKAEHLAAQLQALLRRGWRAATLVDALTAPDADRTMVVTFDDAHQSVMDLAAPILDRLGVPATVFVPTDYADTDRLMAWDGYDMWVGTAHEQELRCLSWDRLRELAGRGWEIASHTCSHPRLTTVGDEQLATELERSRQICEERMGVPCRSIAYPYGDHDDRVVRAARDAGYMLGVTAPTRASAALPLAWPRVAVYQGEDAKRVMLRAWRRRHATLDESMRRVVSLASRGSG